MNEKHEQLNGKHEQLLDTTLSLAGAVTAIATVLKVMAGHISSLLESHKELRETIHGIGETAADNGKLIEKVQSTLAANLLDFQQLMGDVQESQ